MSFDFKFSFALFLCFVSLIVVGCSSSTEEVAKAPEKAKVENTTTPDDLRPEKKSYRNTDPNPSHGIAIEDEKSAPTEPAVLPPKGEDLPKEENVIRKVPGFDVAIADGALNFVAPATWKKGKAGSRFVEYEISVPKSDGDDNDGRLTIMRAGGSVEANIERWYGQYSQPDGGATKDVAKVGESKIGENKAVWVDISGTLQDRPGGPMAGGKVVEREDYRMLAAIVQAGEHGQCFVKLYGPRRTISDNEAAFRAFVESLKINDEAKGL